MNREIHCPEISYCSFHLSLLTGLKPSPRRNRKNGPIPPPLEYQNPPNYIANSHASRTLDEKTRVTTVIKVESLNCAKGLVINSECGSGIAHGNSLFHLATHGKRIVIRRLAG